ncbi:hypothetical protein [Fulvivirga imtechensis]|nr:hypothetical protein [Fulvivirga imtechensis]
MNRFLVLLFTCYSCFSYAQLTQQEKINQQVRNAEQAKHAELMRIMDQGVELMADGKHEEANTRFKEVLKSAKVVPTDLCFYFGKNSFYLGKYTQSIDWLNKYIQLRGTTGQFYDESIEYLDRSKEAFLVVREGERKEAQNILTTSYDIDCGPSGKVICPVCKGKGVIITKGAFGDTYKACPYSDDHGYLTCEEYNKLLRGQLEPKF